MQAQANNQKAWVLSQYELNRTPQEAITDGTEIVVSQRTLHNELMCPICLDMLKNTMTTKECLHRFCQECITRALRNVNRECPTCRKKLISRRSLRPDPNFDALIAKIYPSRDEYEAHQERMMMRIKEQHNPKELTASLTEGIRWQKLQMPHRPARRTEEDDEPTAKRSRADHDSSYEYGDFAGAELDTPGTNTEIELILLPHPDEKDESLKRRFVKTTTNATMFHLAKFLTIRRWLETNKDRLSAPGAQALANASDSEFQIFLCEEGEHKVLDGLETLDEVAQKYRAMVPGTKPVELYFKVK